MSDCFIRATNLKKKVLGLSEAECVAVCMYTDDGDAKAFYKDYYYDAVGDLTCI